MYNESDEHDKQLSDTTHHIWPSSSLYYVKQESNFGTILSVSWIYEREELKLKG